MKKERIANPLFPYPHQWFKIPHEKYIPTPPQTQVFCDKKNEGKTRSRGGV
jgi:hypothetical protein